VSLQHTIDQTKLIISYLPVLKNADSRAFLVEVTENFCGTPHDFWKGKFLFFYSVMIVNLDKEKENLNKLIQMQI
jgi:hypothetical protein